MWEPLGLDPHAKILTWLIVRDRQTINRLKFKTGDQRATRCFLYDAESTRSFPAALFSGVFTVDLRFAIDKYIRQHAIGFAPGIQHLLAWAEHLIQRRQQMAADNIVLLRFDLEAGVFLRDFFDRRQKRRKIIDIAGISRDGVKQGFALIAVALVAHVENLFELRVVREHAIVEMGGEFWSGFNQQGNSGLDRSDGLSV
ncbi:hypothetical protein D3C80_1138440 [compost metagenome]